MQKTKKFRRLLAGGVAVLMLGVSVPVAAFATGDGTTTSTTQTADVTFGVEFHMGDEYIDGWMVTMTAGNHNYS